MKLAPYGIFPGVYKELASNETRVMADWRPTETQEVRLSSFHKWRKAEADEVARYLWPRYVGGEDWEGAASIKGIDLTNFEIDLIFNEYRKDDAVFDSAPDTPLATSDLGVHRDFFRKEDDVSKKYVLGEDLKYYDSTLDQDELDRAIFEIAQAFDTGNGIGKKVSGLFWFKGQFFRPRPYQVAALFKKYHFSSEMAFTGLHSSMFSGHCIQGALIGCSVYEAWLLEGKKISDDRLTALAQYSMDFGDRRVMAGVHYPSDNFASWGIALSLIPEIFAHSDEIRNFLGYAITNRSDVYRRCADAYELQGFEKVTEYIQNKIISTTGSLA